MRIYPTFAAYLSRQFLVWCLAVFLVLTALIALFDTIELLRRTADEPDTTLVEVIAMMLFKLPHMAQKSVPFAVLFGSMMAFWRLNRHRELVVARAAGISAWQFLLPVVLLALVIGTVKATIYSPFASAMLLRYEQLEARYIRGKSSLAALSGGGLWLRQTTEDGQYVLHAETVKPAQMELGRVTVFSFRDNDRFAYRVDAPRAVLVPGAWRLENARVTGPDIGPVRQASRSIPTDLTRENIQDSFATPETLSFWALPRFIAVLEKAGFSALRHRLYWHSQLSAPLLLSAMVLFAAAFTLRPLRRGGAAAIIGGGIATGFLIYFSSDLVYALGLSARIPVLLAAWSPPVISVLLGAALLFHLEDG